MMHGGGFMGGKREKPSGRVSNRHLISQTAGLFKAHRAGVATIAFLVVITAGAGVVNPVLIKVVFDTALFPTHVVNGATVLLPVNLTLLEVLVGIMIGITIVTGAIGVLQTYITNRVGQRVMEELRNRLYEHLQGMSLRFFTGTRTGEIQSRRLSLATQLRRAVSRSELELHYQPIWQVGAERSIAGVEAL